MTEHHTGYGLSPEAQAWLEMLKARPQVPAPEPHDLEAWRAVVAGASAPEYADALGLATTGAVDTGVPVEVHTLDLPNTVVHVGTPEGLAPDDRRVLLSVHGGAFTWGGGPATKSAARFVAGAYGVTTWSVDYRMPPDHPYPAAPDDCLDAYRTLLKSHDPASIAVGGLSAGGNLVAGLLLRLQEEKLPMPCAVVLNSPAADLTLSGDTLVSDASGEVDGLMNSLKLYTGDHDPTDPDISPLFGRIGADWPPTILFSGTRDFLLSDTVRMHRKLLAAGVRTELHVFEAAPHGMFGGSAPEDRMLVAEARRFLEAAWNER
ncbi:Acetyl esterase/lipase [Streptomyces sp. yr375]|uniref:alpha/beta hydrolase n=1 Tax=Streptomyces sp. yr375 TaxID=1761906 RepID=UPI0008BCDAF6|nr:alpha/beta hydrolase [Streptomyces sp. yr375]SEQ01469.1 Acetyl esterase/lipase [Streptomyces sp. yr375]